MSSSKTARDQGRFFLKSAIDTQLNPTKQIIFTVQQIIAACSKPHPHTHDKEYGPH